MDAAAPLLTSRYREAFAYAAELHATQVRKGTGIPYLTHLMSVSALVLEHGGDEDQAIAGLLHDAAEDQGGARILEEIRARFGPKVASIVDACTDALESPKPPWQPRKERYLAHLQGAPAAVLRVSCADKLHNARSLLSDYRTLGDALWPRFTASREQTLWYYRSLAAIFHERLPGPLSAELGRTVEELASLAGA